MTPAEHRLEIAVVGSGLAGLATAWLLGRRHRVTVFEAATSPGMGAHSLRLGEEGAGPRVDVPLRVFTPGYYPTLLTLYRAAGIAVAPVDYAASFSHLGGDTYFAYRNIRVGGRSLPWIPPTSLLRGTTRRIVADLVRLHRRGPRDLASGDLETLTLADYLDGAGFADDFIEGFVLPAYASICTCTTEEIGDYPADVIVDYLCSGVTTRGVMRAVHGSADVIGRLLASAHEIHVDRAVERVRDTGSEVEVIDSGGGRHRFDHVVVAARADQAATLIEGDPGLVGLLERIPHTTSRVVVHSDPRLAPRDRTAWRPVNFVRSREGAAPMATIWLNRVQDGLDDSPALFQTWNPLVEPRPETRVAEAQVARPLVTLETRGVPGEIAALLHDPRRRVWTVGSYAEPGIPLLEAAATSAARVARRIDPTGGSPLPLAPLA